MIAWDLGKACRIRLFHVKTKEMFGGLRRCNWQGDFRAQTLITVLRQDKVLTFGSCREQNIEYQ